MKIIEKKLSDIHPYDKNPRKNEKAVQYVANSIREFGFKIPMVIKADGEIVCGHTRYKAAVKLGLEKVPCVIADDLSEQQISAFRLADNKVGEVAEWDMDLLLEEIKDISDFDMSQFAFDMSEFEKKDESDVEEVDIPEQVEARCKLGDLWKLGDHRLMCGDCTNIDTVSRLMGGYRPTWFVQIHRTIWDMKAQGTRRTGKRSASLTTRCRRTSLTSSCRAYMSRTTS